MKQGNINNLKALTDPIQDQSILPPAELRRHTADSLFYYTGIESRFVLCFTQLNKEGKIMFFSPFLKKKPACYHCFQLQYLYTFITPFDLKPNRSTWLHYYTQMRLVIHILALHPSKGSLLNSQNRVLTLD